MFLELEVEGFIVSMDARRQPETGTTNEGPSDHSPKGTEEALSGARSVRWYPWLFANEQLGYTKKHQATCIISA